MVNISNIIQSPAFAKQKKKLNRNQIKKLDEAVKKIITNPDIGDLKKGDLQGIRVYKYKIENNLILLAYEIEGSTLYFYYFGSYQNFYRQLSKYLHR